MRGSIAAVGALDALNACGEPIRPGVMLAKIREAQNHATSGGVKFKIIVD